MPPTASSRASHVGPGGHSSMARLMEKRKEHDAVMALDNASAELVERLEALSNDCDIMANAGQVHGTVLEQWARMFRIINLVVPPRNSETENMESSSEPPATAERLVRLEIAALEQGDGGK